MPINIYSKYILFPSLTKALPTTLWGENNEKKLRKDVTEWNIERSRTTHEKRTYYHSLAMSGELSFDFSLSYNKFVVVN